MGRRWLPLAYPRTHYSCIARLRGHYTHVQPYHTGLPNLNHSRRHHTDAAYRRLFAFESRLSFTETRASSAISAGVRSFSAWDQLRYRIRTDLLAQCLGLLLEGSVEQAELGFLS